MRAIDADVFEAFAGKSDGYESTSYIAGVKSVLQAIDELPTLDVAVIIHAKWDNSDIKTNGKYRCTNCSGRSYIRTEYCPDCGALMNREKDNG